MNFISEAVKMGQGAPFLKMYRAPVSVVGGTAVAKVPPQKFCGWSLVARPVLPRLGSTPRKVLFVLGHSACGAVSATQQGAEQPGQISGLFQHIRPAIKEARGDLDLAVRLNVRNQAQILAEASPVIAKMIKQGDLLVAGGVSDLQTGRVSPVDVEME
jgi:hypothetical protein